jgi:hypothetical protein
MAGDPRLGAAFPLFFGATRLQVLPARVTRERDSGCRSGEDQGLGAGFQMSAEASLRFTHLARPSAKP